MTSITSQVNAGDRGHIRALDLDRPVLVYKAFFILLPFVILFASEAIGFTMLLLVLALPLDRRLRRAFERPSYQLVMRSTGLFLGWAVLSMKWAPPGADQHLLSIILLCVAGGLGVLCAACMTGAQKIQVQPFGVVFLGVCVIGLMAVMLAPQGALSRIVGGEVLQAAPVRALSILAVLVWPLIGVMFSKKSGLSVRLATILAGVLVMGLAMAAFKLGVVSNMLALALGGAAFLLVAFLPRVGLAAISILIVGYLLLAPTLHMEFMNEADDASFVSAPNSWAYRIDAWSQAARTTFDTPIRGRGFEGASLSGFGLEQDSALTRQGVMEAPHNLFLRVWLELGLVGSFLLIGVLLGVISAIWRRIDNGLEAGIATAALVSFLTLSLLSNGAWHLWWIGTAWLAAFTVIVCRQSGVYESSSQVLSGAFTRIGVMAPQSAYTAKAS